MGKLERDVESYWTALYFQQQHRANPHAAWQALFLCWFKQDVGERVCMCVCVRMCLYEGRGLLPQGRCAAGGASRPWVSVCGWERGAGTGAWFWAEAGRRAQWLQA